jgi:RHS repeat-associated protein
MPIEQTKPQGGSNKGPERQSSVARAPAISVPKGGGAIRGIGEKFAANPVTGTASLTVPIYTSPGRSGFGPQLSLSYDSGSGNGPFGFGWSFAQPSITRKTDKGLPQYADTEESDTFILSGAEDLVPLLVRTGEPRRRESDAWRRDIRSRTLFGKQYGVHRYRPRVEGLFARVERWVNVSDSQDTFWRSISKDNITTWYGRTAESRIADPADSSRVFTWLICESYDDKGNAIVYRYKSENSDGVDTTVAHERNRTDITRRANRYLKRVFYGNRTPYFPDLTAPAPAPLPADWCFELVFDYGEHDLNAPVPEENGTAWLCRADPFSSYRATFEVRTYRLCRRALMFHHFEKEPGVGRNCLVRSTDLNHAQPAAPSPDASKPFYSYLLSVTQTGYRRNPDLSKSLPPLEFTYSDASVDETVRDIDSESLENLPYGLDGAKYQWVDLDGEGLSGILTEQAGSWFYKSNLSAANLRAENGKDLTVPRFGPMKALALRPSLSALGSGRQHLLDLAGDGQVDLVEYDGPTPGFYERTEDEGWSAFTPFPMLPDLEWQNPNLKFIDLTGDGFADLLISEDDAFCWRASLGKAGFGGAQRVQQALDEEKGPKLIFADGTESIFLADVSGDGLTDILRVRNGEVCYWPNLGYGRFGPKVTMDQAPWFEAPDLFDGRRIRLGDIDGSSTADIIYFASNGVHLYFNQSGNGWGARRALSVFPQVESVSSATAVDLLGNGTACLVWSSPLLGNVHPPMRYVDLMGGQKPHLLIQVANNLGAETRIRYAPSTKFYVADKLAGNPWITRLPFPVHVVEQVETFDYLSRIRFVSRYVYHHGFYDGIEREFHGFGMVEQFDSEEYSYTFSTIDVPGATSTVLFGVNDTRQFDNTAQIVGGQRDTNAVFHSVLTDTRALSFSTFDPDFPAPSRESSALDINAKGQIVGFVGKSDIRNPGARAYIKQGDSFVLFDHPNADPSRGTEFHGINDAGVRVGNYVDDASNLHGFMQNDNTTTLLEASPDMPANKGNFLFDINNLGQMVGGYFDATRDIQHGLLTDGTNFVTIDFPGSDTTWLNRINDLGQMTGAYFDNVSQVFRGFLTDGKNFVTLDYPNLPANFGTFITGINNSGRIVGYYGPEVGLEGVVGRAAGVHGFLATPASGRARLSPAGQGQPFSPPSCTKTWFHTGAYFGAERISKHFEKEYYHEGDTSDAIAGLLDDQLEGMLLDDTVLPTTLRLPGGGRLPYDLTGEEAREAARALKGSILRQEIYAADGTDAADLPYTASERNYTIEALQPQGENRHAVFFAHARETIDFHYERKLFKVSRGTLVDPNNPPRDAKDAADPRVTHAVTLSVDPFGNVLQSIAIGYGRRYLDPALTQVDQAKQSVILITYSENGYTNAIAADDVYRIPLPCETRTYELRKPEQERSSGELTQLYRFNDLLAYVDQAGDGKHDVAYEDIDFTKAKQAAANDPAESKRYFRRPIEHVRTLYRPNDMGIAAGDSNALLPPCQLQSLALPGVSYRLSFTPGLLSQVYQRGQENLLPVRANVLPGTEADRGGYVDLDGDGRWWVPSGRVFYHSELTATPQQELNQARRHFFLPRRFEDPFGKSSTVDYDGHELDFEGHDLLIVRTTDAVGNAVAAINDYRVLQPTLVTDPNENRAAVSFDVLGLVAGTVVRGKETEDLGDSFDAFAPDLSPPQVNNFFGADDPHILAGPLLGTATTRIVYDVDRFRNTRDGNPTDPSKWEPVFAATLARETHSKDSPPPGGLKIQISFSYSDGFGREIQKKIQAEPGSVLEGGSIVNPRWVGNGWTIFNNKGKPVRQYEPFFSQLPSQGHRFEFGVKIGVSPILCYDPVERVVATIHPNHTYEKVVFDPWRQESWDVNDTVRIDPKSDPDVGSFFLLLSDDDYLPTWHARRIGGELGREEQDAANKAAVHASTPSVAYFDTLGRTFLTIARNRFQHDDTTVEESYLTRVGLDIEGNQRDVRDALVQAGDAQGRIVMRYDYDMLGNRIHQASMDAGERWVLNDVTGKPIRAWDSRGHDFRTAYDALRRAVKSFVSGASPQNPTRETLFGQTVFRTAFNALRRAVNSFVSRGDPQNPTREILFEQTVYGEGLSNDKALNLRTRVAKNFDAAGVVTSEAYDFKGNLLGGSREVARDYKGLIDWNIGQPPGELFSTSTTYDALNRPTSVTTPDGSVYRPTYNEANLLDKVDVNLLGAATVTPFVTNIDYNAKGQRTRCDYFNGASTTYKYEPDTFRLSSLATQRGSTALQDLRYAYDPTGNITHIKDAAQQTIYFDNQVVTPDTDYTYDAIYRLIATKGREHIGQLAQPETTWNDEFRVNLPHPQEGQAMRNYTEQYQYDGVGNFEQLVHQAVNGNWTRTYAYNEASLLEPTTKKSNRLSSTTVGQTRDTYTYQDLDGRDVQGCMTSINTKRMDWDFKDQLQRVDLVGGGTAYYTYDATGQRVRKVIEKNQGNLIEERIYLGRLEIFRQRSGNDVKLEREALHVMDDKQRIALVETRTQGDDDSPPQLIRYQLSNHLGSASVELDDQAQVISYEEYYPYGSTSYQAVNKSIKAAAKRYRYSGKERDEETGLYYHGARYYSPWLGRWTSCDRSQALKNSMNPYRMAENNPVRSVDLTGNDSTDALVEFGEDLKSVNRLIASGNPALAMGLGLGDLTATLITGKVEKEGKFYKVDRLKVASDALESAVPIYGAAKVVGESAGSLKENIDKANRAGTTRERLRHYVDAAADASTIATTVMTELVVHEHAMRTSGGKGAAAAASRVGREAEAASTPRPPAPETASAAPNSVPADAPTAAPNSMPADAPTAASAAAPAAPALVGSSPAQMRAAAERLIASQSKHPLKFLLDRTGHFKSTRGLKHSELANRRDLVQMGHITSKKSGEPERIMLQGAWENQFSNVTVEHPSKGAHMENVAIDIGGIAVDRETAKLWEREGLIPAGTVQAARRINP